MTATPNNPFCICPQETCPVHEFDKFVSTPNKPTQDDLLDFVSNPENVKKAVEGSMQKRESVLANKPSEELAAILAEFPADHDDDDHNTCASSYSRCSQCGKRVYWANQMSHTKSHAAAVRWVNDKCDCHVAEDIARLKAALQTAIDTAVEQARIDERKELKRLFNALRMQFGAAAVWCRSRFGHRSDCK